MNIKVRKASKSDSEDIFTWRNDDKTRKMSFSSDRVDWDGHSKWFLSSLKNPNRVLYMCEGTMFEGSIGIVRFDIDKHKAIVSINLNPKARGKGLSKGCINNAIDTFLKSHADIKSVVAEIKEENEASQSAFVSAGFRLMEKVGETLVYQFEV